MSESHSQAEVTRLLEEWRQAQARETEVVMILDRLCEIFEKETEAYYKMDPDPMDDRHPGRASPQCVLGQLMKMLFRQEELMTKMVSEYMMGGRVGDCSRLHTASCRLMLVVLPGLETSVVSQETEGLVERFLTWARDAEEPLRSYATGLLGGAMDIQDIAHAHKEANVQLVPIMLKRLHEFRATQEEEQTQQARAKMAASVSDTSVRHFADIGHSKPPTPDTSKTRADIGHSNPLTPDNSKTRADIGHSNPPTPGVSKTRADIGHAKPPTPDTAKTRADIGHSKPPTPDNSKSRSDIGHSKPPTPDASKTRADISHSKPLTPDNSKTRADIGHSKPPTPGVSKTRADIGHSKPPTPDASKTRADIGHSKPPTPGVSKTRADIGHSKPPTPDTSKTRADIGNSNPPTPDNSKTRADILNSKHPTSEDSNTRTNIWADTSATDREKTGDKPVSEPCTNENSSLLESPVVSVSSSGSSMVSPFVSRTPVSGVSPASTPEGGVYRASLKRSLSPAHSLEYLGSKRARTRNDSYGGVMDPDTSNSSWAEMEPFVIGCYSLKHPLSVAMKARLVLQYLATMGDYQELLSSVFEGQALDLIFFYIDLAKNNDVRLAFEALKYLSTLLCHKKFTIEFLQREGVQRLLRICRPSIAATGVALCLYYLSYFEDAMEKVCLLPDYVLGDLVGYMLWLMECSHDSSRCHACMFFSQVFPFRVMLDLFDQRGGLRRLFNVVSTLSILDVNTVLADMNEDQVFTSRQAARHVCGALKKYFEAHLILKAQQVRRSHCRSNGTPPLHEAPAYKPLKMTPQVILESLDLLMELLPLRNQWTPEHVFHQLGGPQLLVQLIGMAPLWSSYTGKPETIKSALDVLHVLTVTPKSQMVLLSSVPVERDKSVPAMSLLVGLAEGEVFQDSDVQKSALNILINCICGPSERFGGGVGRYMGSGTKRKVNLRAGHDLLSLLWNHVQTNNGIMVLLKLLSVKVPITDADSIRALACRALVGLARSDTVKQILGKLPIFNNGQLQYLMKEPVLQDKRQEHVKFCQQASLLLERVLGKESNTFDASLEDIRRADIVAQTKINYREKELVQLIHHHLISKGLTESAAVLQREAGLPRCSTPPPPHPASPHIFSPSAPKLTRQLSQPTPTHPVNPSPHLLATPTTSSFALPATPTAVNHADSSTPVSTVTPSPGPLRFTLQRNSINHSPHNKMTYARSRFMRESGGQGSHRTRSSAVGRSGAGAGEYNMSLDNIVTEYLRKQHALCRNPVSTCPPMSLFEPHRCPEPLGRRTAPQSITSRLLNRSILPPYGGSQGAKLNRKLFYSRFHALQSYRDKEDDSFACCAFSYDEDYLMLGTYGGEIKLLDIQQWEESMSLQCHNSPVVKIQPGHQGKLLLTSSIGGTDGEVGLWRYEDMMDIKYKFPADVGEFSKVTQDRIVTTRESVAKIYDVGTGQELQQLFAAEKANYYKVNSATFSPTDQLVLNDGVLWDVRGPTALHKFDKFNQYISGVFHPQGLEIIINTEVWDVRTYKLLHTVPALDLCQIKFNHNGDVIFAIRVEDELDEEEARKARYSSTLRTFDATDYSSIGTLDLKTRCVFDVCTNRVDSMMAVVEAASGENSFEVNNTRLYQMQKLRDEEDNEPEEEEEGEAGDEDDDDDDDDDDQFALEDIDDDDDDDDQFNFHFGSSPERGDGDDENNNDNGDANGNANNGDNAQNNPDDDDDDDGDDDDDDGDSEDAPFVMEFSPSNSEEDDDDDDDNDDNDNDLDDDMLFALAE